jgi:hypothetical protein
MLRERFAAIVAAQAAADRAVVEFLELARDCEAGDHTEAEVVFEVAEAIGRCGQGLDGQLVQALAQADRISARKGVLKPWIATHLDVSDSKARGIAEAARRIGAIPELAESLSSGRVGADTIRTSDADCEGDRGHRTGHHRGLDAVLEVSARDGVSAANREIRELEHALDPGSSQELLAKQRARSFARVIELEDGRCRVEALLDPVRATIVRSAIDQAVSAWIREGQYDGTDPLPEDVRTTEQMNAHALVRMAEVFVTAPSEVRGVKFTPPMLFTAPLNEADGRVGGDGVRDDGAGRGNRGFGGASAGARRGWCAGPARRGEN